ncbi:hypothetical protein E2C01_064752 [Portunus trituberculatus]|uniref:Uncharacterized protein n=1 Tax=Portunus trituberculatus TaxID=210409 RepID=A0A5B7HK04_PORTR|nr:hypothetical protein [Portunus trituberculatus]
MHRPDTGCLAAYHACALSCTNTRYVRLFAATYTYERTICTLAGVHARTHECYPYARRSVFSHA